MVKAGQGGRWDAVIVGGGHNGLVSAFYLARAGVRTLVLERRPIVGGACVTEEFAPGFRASTGAYVLSMLRQSIWQDMRLAERGLTVSPAGPSLNLFPDGTTFLLDDELDRTVEETRRFSPRDARRLAAFEAGLGELAAAIGPLFDTTPPDPAAMHPRDLLGTSVSQYLDEWFESDHLKASLGWHAINDSVAGPGTPGTAYVLLHDHAAEDAGGGIRRWGFVPGGIGEVTRMMADAAREAGAEIRTESPVARVLVDGGAATGVELESGEVIEASTVLSNADPKHTFLTLCDEADLPERFLGAVEAYRCTGTSIKINLAVDRLPAAAAMNGNGTVQGYQRGIMEITSTL